MNVAVIDCGTNSTRLLIVDANGDTLVREMTITRLGQELGRTGVLHPDALERVYACLTRYRELMDQHGVSRGRLVATSAARDAANGAEFLATCRTITGIEPVLLSGNEEAWASYLGATADLPPSVTHPMIIDIGGGSTELAFREGRELVAHSMQLGCVRVTEAHLGRDAASATMIANAQVMIDAEIQRLFRVEPKFESARGAVSLVGLAGTIATLAQLDVGLREYQREVVHHHVLTRDVVEHWIDVLAGESAAERLSHPGMVEGREDVLLGGLLVLRRVMHEFGVSSLLSSECDILDGVAAQLQGRVQGRCRESN